MGSLTALLDTGRVMSDANVDVVRRFLSRLSDGEIEVALADLAPDAELDWTGSEAPDSGVYHGHAAWRAWFTSREEGFANCVSRPAR